MHNPYSPSALAGLGGVYKSRGDYRKVGVDFRWVLCNVVVSFQLKEKKTLLALLVAVICGIVRVKYTLYST